MADRNPSKQKRQRQNQAARAARAARTANAAGSASTESANEQGAANGGVFSRRRKGASAESSGRPTRTAAGVARATGTASRPARVASTKAASSGSSSSGNKRATDSGAGAGSSEKSSARPARYKPPARPLPGWLDRFGGNEPGGRLILLAFVLTLVASVSACFMKVVAFTETVNGKQVVTKNVTALHWGLGRGLAIVAPAPVAVGLAILLARPPNRRRTWYFGAAALFMVTMTSGFLYLAAFGIMAWGCMQARRAALDEVGGDSKALRERDRAALRGGRFAKYRDADEADEVIEDDGGADSDHVSDDFDEADYEADEADEGAVESGSSKRRSRKSS